jgi:hypothetical protein
VTSTLFFLLGSCVVDQPQYHIRTHCSVPQNLISELLNTNQYSRSRITTMSRKMPEAERTMFRFPTFRDTPTCQQRVTAQSSLQEILRRDSQSSKSRPTSAASLDNQRTASTSTTSSAISPTTSRTSSPRSSQSSLESKEKDDKVQSKKSNFHLIKGR